MIMEITADLVSYLEKLGRIKLTPEEEIRTQKELGSILAYIDKLGELDTEGVEPLSHAFGRTNVTREDVVTNGDMQDLILSNAKESKDGAILVPKTVE
ncbi:MAG: Asp-tRNA(Asn)/Glu-tRNA(Gln) amidotransferase subunit GatC [Clostridiales bacterium]|nr:Asp-tRNA(Asn)/Glu-tRNA(Gln) amidotransferase subunit GatC [Clostridiales bacterium]